MKSSFARLVLAGGLVSLSSLLGASSAWANASPERGAGSADGKGRWQMFSRRMGLFVHWGIYSVGGWHEQEQMRRGLSREAYARKVREFRAERFSADDLVAQARTLDADYLVFTSKHHDGFCMWDTKTTDFNSVRGAPAGRDFVREISDACRRGGVKFGLYYSNPDWHHPNAYNPLSTHQIPPCAGDRPDLSAYRAYVVTQVTELLTGYGEIACLFWDIPPHVDDPEMNRLARRLQPGILVNDRGWSKGDYSTPERGLPPGAAFTNLTEACDSVGVQSWGYRANEDYRTVRSLTCSADSVLARGGNFLLNVGPRPDGALPEQAKRCLAGVGAWHRRVREAFRDVTTETGVVADTKCLVTRRGDVLYLHYPEGLASSGLNLSPLSRLPVSATLLNTGKPVAFERTDLPSEFWKKTKGPVLHLKDLPAEELDGVAAVIELRF